MKNKLIDLIDDAMHDWDDVVSECQENGELPPDYFVEHIADHLMGSGFISELLNASYDLGANSVLSYKLGLSWNDVDDLRKEIKRLQDAERWISVEERLPEEDGKYLTYTYIPSSKHTCIDIASFSNDLYKVDSYDFRDMKGKSGFYSYDECGFYENHGVTHWTHLPKPPKEEE